MRKRFVVTVCFLFVAFLIMNGQTQTEMNIKVANELKLAEGKMYKVYRELLAKSDSSEKSMLMKSQVAWEKYREVTAKYYAKGYEGGTAYPMILLDYKKVMTIARTKELQTFINESN